MGTQVPKTDAPVQFLFTVSPDAPLMNGFRINNDGSLAPLPGSPLMTSVPMRSAVAVHNALIVAGKDSMFAFAVNKKTGVVQQTDEVRTGAISQVMAGQSADVVVAKTEKGAVAFWVSNGKLKVLPETMAAAEVAAAKAQPQAVLDASGKFMYVTDTAKAEIAAFQIENGKAVPLSPPAYPVPHGTVAVALVKPDQ